MEPIFQNRYIITKPLLEEYYKRHTNFWRKSSLIIYVTVFVAVLMIFYRFKHLYFDSLFYAFFSAFLFILPFSKILSLPDRKAESCLKNIRKKEADDLARVVEFGENIAFIAPSLDHALYFDYFQIIKIIESKNLYSLVLTGKVCLLVEKGSFSVGDEEEFISFLKEKCENLKILKVHND